MRHLFGAVDIGASSGRVIAGLITDGQLTISEVHRFSNGPVESDGGKLFWDFQSLISGVKRGLRELGARAERLDLPVTSIGIDTWAVDYGLVSSGQLLANPRCYRDPENELGVREVHSKTSFDALYSVTGIQFLPFNSIYQIARQAIFEPELIESADHMLMIPDLIGFELTGVMATERTNASSTGLLDAKTRQWSQHLAEQIGIPVAKFPLLRNAGETLGPLIEGYGPRLGNAKVVLVGSHDTASAVVGVPSLVPGSFYLSSGTWSLLGTELDEPILSSEAREANFTNELGVDGKIRFLKNLSGLWLLNESIRHWNESDSKANLSDLLEEAKGFADPPRFDVNHSSLVPPGDMPGRIQELLSATGAKVHSRGELVASILHSLAKSYSENLERLQELTGMTCRRLHVIGGGSQNEFLNQLTANYCKVEVLAGPVEATAIGNLLVQARSAGILESSLTSIRKVILDSNFGLRTFQPF